MSRTLHRRARCSISSQVPAPHTQTHTKKENVIKSFLLKNEFLKYPEQAHVRKYYLSCSYFSVHLGHSSVLGPGLLGSETFVVHLSSNVPVGGTISYTLLCPMQKTLDTLKMLSYKLPVKRGADRVPLCLSMVFTVRSDASKIPHNLCILRKTQQSRIHVF